GGVVGVPWGADSPWATRCRPRVRGLVCSRRAVPKARGLALGYMLSPASTRARVFASCGTQGSRTRPGLHAVAREYAGSYVRVVRYPGLADSPWATRCRPRVRARLGVPRARGAALG